MTTTVNADIATLALEANLPPTWSLADLQQHLGGVPLERVRLIPPLGYATEDDILRIEDRLYLDAQEWPHRSREFTEPRP